MAIEQERRFLVRGPFPKTGGVALSQGYLSTVKERTVRVRTMGDKAFITVKGETDAAGKRIEFEYEIPIADAKEMMGLCAPYPIEKTRYTVNDAGNSWEIDEFHGHNQGLVIAEMKGRIRIDRALKARPAWSERTSRPRSNTPTPPLPTAVHKVVRLAALRAPRIRESGVIPASGVTISRTPCASRVDPACRDPSRSGCSLSAGCRRRRDALDDCSPGTFRCLGDSAQTCQRSDGSGT